MSDPSDDQPGRQRLDSWKLIAAYLKRGVTTVQRWERTEALPVHRLAHQRSGSVFAYSDELDEWWRQRSARLEVEEPEASSPAETELLVEADEPLTGPPSPSPHSSRRIVAALLGALVIAALGWLGARRVVAPPRPVLAVLPFENLGGVAEHEYLADGVTEELITLLARTSPDQLGVIARTSVMPYKARPKPIRDVGRELGAQYVVVGSVRPSGEGLRVTVQLIDVRTETHLWAQSYDRSPVDLLLVEADMATAIAARLSLSRTRAASEGVGPAPAAHEAYLKGLYFWNRRDEEGVQRAIERFEEAIARSPGFARAHAGLSMAHASLASAAEAAPAAKARDLAQASAARALELAPDEPDGHAALSVVYCRFDWSWRDCESELQRAVELDPNYATARHWLGEHLLQRGRLAEAQAELERARTLDPLSPTIHTHVGLSHMYAGRYEPALLAFQEALQIDDDFLLARRARGLTLVRMGRVEDGLAALHEARRTNPRSAHTAADLGYALARSGRRDEAARILADLDELAKTRPVSAYDFAVVHAGLGDRTQTVAWLNKAYDERATGVRWLKVETIFEALRADPQFLDLVRRVGLPD